MMEYMIINRLERRIGRIKAILNSRNGLTEWKPNFKVCIELLRYSKQCFMHFILLDIKNVLNTANWKVPSYLKKFISFYVECSTVDTRR